ncbi:putative motility protein [Campylobacter hepaticus]|uniref:Putative motility protein n=1 Tax=Campylobacter hepaticus TaxID=1813019 RepID=A0A424Z1T2_9BACT|nr:putative motility protein [Campylobacter hepaticus]RQD68205.1 putative motility protein [Campylobacter hepaticus]RQD88062.1 putative motility protein [Campylobacter hepaticus]
MALDIPSNACLMSTINTSILKKSMDLNEELLNKLMEGMQECSESFNAEVLGLNSLDIYA